MQSILSLAALGSFCVSSVALAIDTNSYGALAKNDRSAFDLPIAVSRLRQHPTAITFRLEFVC